MNITQIQRKASDFQQPVNESLLQEALIKALPTETIVEVTELSGGMFNNTFVVITQGDKYILKIAPHSNARVLFHEKQLMQREKCLSVTLRQRNPLIPEYISFFNINDRCSFLQKYVKGDLWHDVIDKLSLQENERLWRQLGEFAHNIHSVEGNAFGYPAPQKQFALWSEFVEWNIKGLVQNCRKFGVVCPEIDTYLNQFRCFSDALAQIKEPKLLHGDLWPRNVIIGGQGDDIHIKAVIDAERAFWGDPVSDWVLILYNKPDSFWQGYGQNLLCNDDAKNTGSVRIAIYKGMYFIVNILEAARLDKCILEARGWLADINKELSNMKN